MRTFDPYERRKELGDNPGPEALAPEGRALFPALTVRDNLLLGRYAHVRRAGWLHDHDLLQYRAELVLQFGLGLIRRIAAGRDRCRIGRPHAGCAAARVRVAG